MLVLVLGWTQCLPQGARSRRSASHAAGTHGWLPQKTGRPGLRRGGVGGYNLHSDRPRLWHTNHEQAVSVWCVIQESKLTSRSKNPCIQNYNTVHKYHPHGQGVGLLIFHRSVTFSKRSTSAESLSDRHMEKLFIKAEIGNTKLIISNIYIPPASCCNNGYQSSIEHLLTAQDTLILCDFNAHHPSWHS